MLAVRPIRMAADGVPLADRGQLPLPGSGPVWAGPRRESNRRARAAGSPPRPMSEPSGRGESRIETQAIHAGEPRPRIHGAVVMPIFQSATFEHDPGSATG